MNEGSKEVLNDIMPDDIPVEEGLFDYPVKKGRHPALLGNCCNSCGKRFFPKRSRCPSCLDQGQMENITLDRKGIIYACTVVHIPSPAGIKAPYAYGYVDIPVDNIRVFALFTGEDPFSFYAGQKVELVLEPIKQNKDGQQVIGYKFKPEIKGCSK